MYTEKCIQIDLEAATTLVAATNSRCRITPYVSGGCLAYQVDLLVQEKTGCEIQVIRKPGGNAEICVADAAFPQKLFNINPTTLKQALVSWATLGWNERSTLARPINGAISFLEALLAEEGLVSGKKVGPSGMKVIHNTRADNVDSILSSGLLTSKSRCFTPGIWARPPSFGKLEASHFTGNLSLVVDISGLKIKSASGYEIVIAENISPHRFTRAIDLGQKKDV